MIDLKPHIVESYNRLKGKLESVGWVEKDSYGEGSGYFEYNVGTSDSYCVFYPVLLNYNVPDENNTMKNITTIWFKTQDKEIDEKALQATYSVMKPFKDEDYVGHDEWFSPDYPDGYWENHVLGDD